MRCLWIVYGWLLASPILPLELALAGETDLSRLKVDDQISKKSSNSDGSINDKRQDIAGFLTLVDSGSSLQKPLGAFGWKTLLFGRPCGPEEDKAAYLVLSTKEGEGDLPLQGRLRMEVEPVSTVYDKMGSGKFGYEYFGYVVVIRSRGESASTIVKADKKVLEQNPETLDRLNGGELLDKSWKVVRKGVRPSEGLKR